MLLLISVAALVCKSLTRKLDQIMDNNLAPRLVAIAGTDP
jgi:hypothetical protein